MTPRVRLTLDPTTGILHARPRGRLTPALMLEPLAEAYAEWGADAFRSILWDLGGISHDMAYADLRLLATRIAQVVVSWQLDAALAIVADTPFRFGVARQFQALLPEDIGIVVEVFPDIDQGRDYLTAGDGGRRGGPEGRRNHGLA